MASGGKKRTTMAKLTRENKLRERRVDKAAKKNARKQDSEYPPDQTGDAMDPELADSTAASSGQTQA